MRILLWLALSCLTLGAVAAAASPQAAPTPAGDITFLEDPMEGDTAITGDLSVSAGDRVQFVVNYQDDSSCYLLDIAAPRACFYKVAGGATKALGLPGELPPAQDAPYAVSILRKDYRLIFTSGGQVVCRGWDGSLQDGKVGYVAAGEQVAEPFVQPMAPVKANDNFMRERDAQHMWTPLSGVWEIESLRDDDQADEMEADKSANAFSYQSVSREGPAISIAEQDLWFWTNYRVKASMRSLGDGAMGLVLLLQDESNYIAFRWASSWSEAPRGKRAELLEVTNGQPKVLAEMPGGFIPDQWYKLSAAACDGHIVCSIDDVPILEGYSDRFGHGSAGLYSEGDDRTFFDDVAIADYEVFHEDFSNMVRWEAAEGEWSLTNSGEARCAKSGVLTSGRLDWTDYRVEATATPNRGRLGLLIARQADGRAVLYRIGLPGSPDGGKAQLLTVGPDGEELLAERDLKVPGGRLLRLAASVEQGFVYACLDGRPVIEGYASGCTGGGIGLYADGQKEARFDDVRVSFLAPKRPAHVTREFQKSSEHPEMAEWASRRAPWVKPPEMGPGATWWTKGDYYDDATVTFKVRFIGLRDGTVKVTLSGQPESDDEGIHLVLSGTKGSRLLKARVLDGASEIAQGEIELDKSSCHVRFARHGAHILVAVNDEPIIAQKL